MKNKSINILIVAFVLLSLLAVVLIVFIKDTREGFEENITVSADGVTETTLEVRDLTLVPTDKKEYSVNLVCAATGTYDVSLSYDETLDGGMKNFVNVLVTYDNKLAYDGRLVDLIDNSHIIEFECELTAKTPVVVKISYEMPYEVGNEAQNTYADFDVKLKLVKK